MKLRLKMLYGDLNQVLGYAKEALPTLEPEEAVSVTELIRAVNHLKSVIASADLRKLIVKSINADNLTYHSWLDDIWWYLGPGDFRAYRAYCDSYRLPEWQDSYLLSGSVKFFVAQDVQEPLPPHEWLKQARPKTREDERISQ